MTKAVVTLLQEEKISFSLTKWEPHDFMIRLEFSEIVQSVDIFSRVMNQVDLTHFQEINDFLNYLFIKKITYLWSIADSIVENKEAKEKIEHVCNIAKEHRQRLNKSALLSFFNDRYNIGVRLIEEYLAKTRTRSLKSFKSSCENIASVAFPMFIGITASVDNWNEDEQSCILSSLFCLFIICRVRFKPAI